MTDETRLDLAFAATQMDTDDDVARLAFFEALAGTELFLLLEAKAEGDQINPRVLEMYDETFVMAFDLEARMTDLTEGAVPYAAVSGRVLAQMLAPQGIGIALNIDVAPSSTFILGEEVVWLNSMLSQAPQEVEQGVSEVFAPTGLPRKFLTALDARLAASAGMAHSAYLVGARYQDGTQGHLLGVIDAVPGAEGALAQAVSEVLTFSGLEAAMLDVAFFRASDPVTARLAKEGLRFDLPQPEVGLAPSAPGMDPDKPPRLH